MPSNETFPLEPDRTGQLLFYENFHSRFVRARNINVWLPPGYNDRSDFRYPVIYAHDGQNLFNPDTSYAGVAWGIDETLGRMILAGEVQPAIVVGIWNSIDRYREYDPQQVFEEFLSSDQQAEYAAEFGLPLSDEYLRFLVEELKPAVDNRFLTIPGQQSTFLIGSSMGGLISAYALCQYPGLFGAVAALSTHWPACCGRTVDYLAGHLPPAGRHRFYFDYGTETDDAPYEPLQKSVDALLQRRGYREGKDCATRKFQGDEHSERAWRSRLHIPLRFLLAAWA